MFFLKALPTRQMIENYAEKYPIRDVSTLEDALHMMRKASLLIREIEGYFHENNTSFLRFLVLIVIDREIDKTYLYVNEIAERIDVSRPVMTRTLRRMLETGEIDMSIDENDTRAKRVVITEKGIAQLNDLLPMYYDIIDQFMRSEH